MRTVTGASEVVFTAAAHHFQAVIQIYTKRLFECEHSRFAIHQCQHDDAEGVLQWRELEQVLKHLCRIGVTLTLDYDPQTLAVTFVTQISDSLQFVVAHEGG